jgi:hypothetical protein
LGFLEKLVNVSNHAFGLEGLGHIEIGARSIAFFDRFGRAARRQEQNGKIAELRMIAYGAASLMAVHKRHHNIQNDEIGFGPLDLLECVETVVGLDDLIGGAQSEPNNSPNVFLVVHDQNPEFTHDCFAPQARIGEKPQ